MKTREELLYDLKHYIPINKRIIDECRSNDIIKNNDDIDSILDDCVIVTYLGESSYVQFNNDRKIFLKE